MNMSDYNGKSYYQVDESPPELLSLGLGLQYTMITITSVVLIPTIIIRHTGMDASYLSWSIFAALVCVGITTALQGLRVRRLGSGYLMLMGGSASHIAICHSALVSGGPALLTTLIVVSSLLQLVLAAKLSLLRRIITPAVAGTLMMLIPVTVMPIIFNLLKQNAASTMPSSLNAVGTIVLISTLALCTTGLLRIWAPIIGIVGGCLMAWPMGGLDFTKVMEANWIDMPLAGREDVSFVFDPTLLALLPGFVLTTLVVTVKTVGDSAAIQGISWRRNRAVDFRAVQWDDFHHGRGQLAVRLSWNHTHYNLFGGVSPSPS